MTSQPRFLGSPESLPADSALGASQGVLPNLRYVLEGCPQGLHQGGGGAELPLRTQLLLGPQLPLVSDGASALMVEAAVGCSHPQFFPAEPGSLVKGPCSAYSLKDTKLGWSGGSWPGCASWSPAQGTGTDTCAYMCSHVMSTCRPLGIDVLSHIQAHLRTGPHRAPF